MKGVFDVIIGDQNQTPIVHQTFKNTKNNLSVRDVISWGFSTIPLNFVNLSMRFGENNYFIWKE